MRRISPTAAVYVLVLAGSAFVFQEPAGPSEPDVGALDRVRERLIDSALRREQGGKDTSSGDEIVGSKWWVVRRRITDPHLRAQFEFDDTKWFTVTRTFGGTLYFIKCDNNGSGCPHSFSKDEFETLVKRKAFVTYDPTEEVKAEIQKEKASAKTAAVKARATRIAAIKAKKWPIPIEQAVIERQVQIGMTAEQVAMAWGKPTTNNRSVGSWGTHEQWVYGDTYLYFQNGVLTSYQERR